MSIRKTIGGDRLGSGKKMQVDLKTYSRSTHDLGYIWRSTMAAGTLVPFMSQIALPGDTFDIDLDIDVKTHPTIGPMFGSYKVQCDVFKVPIRLYQSGLHNNALGIGMRMKDILLPQMKVPVPVIRKDADLEAIDVDNIATSPDSLLAYLNVRFPGIIVLDTDEDLSIAITREMNAVPLVGYWDIVKNYYANKQEEIGMMISADLPPGTITEVYLGDSAVPEVGPENLPQSFELGELQAHYGQIPTDADAKALTLKVRYQFAATVWQADVKAVDLYSSYTIVDTGQVRVDYSGLIPVGVPGTQRWVMGYYPTETPDSYIPAIKSFPLDNIDRMREEILAAGKFDQFLIDNETYAPYGDSLKYKYDSENAVMTTISSFSQQALALKTYQSDLFNNYMSTEWVDNATTGINAITAIDTSDGSFTIDTLNLSQKVYDMLNRIAISGGTYDDWLQTVYTHDYMNRSETPVYEGGLSKELVFQEVVSTAEAGSEIQGAQPLGTLAGKGVMSKKHKGGKIVVKIDEPCYIMGIVSLTPRVDYSQGNQWDMNLKNMDNLHKPALDEIGFQDLITEQMAGWSTSIVPQGAGEGRVDYKSAGKQPAWINYMTNVNVVRGNFARKNHQMFMTLNRRYEPEMTDQPRTGLRIGDMTTYIDPTKFNFVFAATDITSQNFWVQMAVDITARRKMSAKIMPNL